jgi:glucose/arabinose dehydrogenase
MNRHTIRLPLACLSLLYLVGCEGPADPAANTDPDVVSGASQPASATPQDIAFESAGMSLVLEPVIATGNVIWAMDFVAPRTMIFTERQGAVNLLDLDTNEISVVPGGPEVKVTDSGGLFDVLVDPEFETNGYVYFTYVKPLGEQSAIAVARSILADGALSDTQDLFVANNPSEDHAHWGSRVVMDGDRKLFFTSGDRHVPDNAQRLASHGGKVLRIEADGAVPADNPFAGEQDAAPEVWSYGHRNPQGLTIHPVSGALYEQEHGPTGGDEINQIVAGSNYGWPVITYGEDIWGGQLPEGSAQPGMQQPLVYFKPGIAPTGLAFYLSDHLPGWQGNAFSSTLRGYMVRLEFDGDDVMTEERLLTSWGERMRDVAEGPDGYLYLATESGKIARVVPAQE